VQPSGAEQNWVRLIVMVLLAGLCGCSYETLGSVDQHYMRFSARVPANDTVYVCSAYGCHTQTPFRFAQADIAKLRSFMALPKNGDIPAEERRAVARTLAWMEKRVGDVVGTSADRPGDDMSGGGDPTQMDCVDVATNLTSYLLVLERHKLLKHHSVGNVVVKEDFFRRGPSGWPHYAAVMVENPSQQRLRGGRWLLSSGQEPEIVEAEKWYIDDSQILFKMQL